MEFEGFELYLQAKNGNLEKAVVSQTGLDLIYGNHRFLPEVLKNKNPFFGEALGRMVRRYPGESGFIRKENIGTLLRPYCIAIKQLYPREKLGPQMYYISGFELFLIYQDLIKIGINCVPPLLAMRDKFVTKWVEGKRVKPVDKWEHDRKSEVNWMLEEYILGLKAIARELKGRGRWNKEWMIDTDGSNYLYFPNRGEDICDKFVAIDPIY